MDESNTSDSVQIPAALYMDMARCFFGNGPRDRASPLYREDIEQALQQPPTPYPPHGVGGEAAIPTEDESVLSEAQGLRIRAVGELPGFIPRGVARGSAPDVVRSDQPTPEEGPEISDE